MMSVENVTDITDMIYSDLQCCIDEENIMRDEPMSKHTSFKIGGPADIYIVPQSKEEFIDAMKVLTVHNYPYMIVGNGTDLLIKDGGIEGAVINTAELNNIQVCGDALIAGAGTTLESLCNAALSSSLTGIEFACGIPGTIGGAVYMNAGAYGGEIKDVCEWCNVIDMKSLKQCKIYRDDMNFGYRTSTVQQKGYITLEACFKLKKGESNDIKSRMDEFNRKRREKQPLEFPSAGSVFKRPEGYYAGKLIEDAGLKGMCVGGAQVSEKHTGFIINRGSASADDVIKLIRLVQRTIKEKFGVDMHPEIKIIGEEMRVY